MTDETTKTDQVLEELPTKLPTKPRKTGLRYSGPDYTTGIVLPPWVYPVDPRSWSQKVIKGYLRKYPVLTRYFT